MTDTATPGPGGRSPLAAPAASKPLAHTTGRLLSRSFFARESPVVARDLLGRIVESGRGPELVAIRLVEVEAYAGEDDPASHAWRGPTPRTGVMFGPPGHAYVYFTYGMHWCANVVCDRSGRASAVLLRSGELVVGEEVARSRRSSAAPTTRLASGPANLAACLGASGADTGQDVTALGSTLRLRQGAPVPDVAVVAGPRIGVSRGTETPWRFQVAGNPHVSGPRRARG